jgi:hypothetical protein
MQLIESYRRRYLRWAYGCDEAESLFRPSSSSCGQIVMLPEVAAGVQPPVAQHAMLTGPSV